MKKSLIFTTIVLALVSCNGGESKNDPNSITLPTELQELGDFSDYATFCKELKLKLAEEQTESSTEQSEKPSDETIKVVTVVSVDVKNPVASDANFGFKLSVVDADYTEIARLGTVFIPSNTDLEANDFSYNLSKGTLRKEKTFTLTSQKWEKILANGAHIIVKPAGFSVKFKAYKEGSKYESKDNDDEKISSSDNASDSNFDELLDSYEKYVDKYIAVMKKAQSGDASAMSEYPDLLEEANNLSEKIQNVKGDLTPSQLSRYTRINNKLLRYAQEMN